MKATKTLAPMTAKHAPREACCPTCGQRASFTFLGEQHWPEKVAQTLGIPAVVEQWLCGRCHTTITEPEPC